MSPTMPTLPTSANDGSLPGMTDSRPALNQPGVEHVEDVPWGWEYWRGVTGTYYARRMKSSPPIVFRAETLDALKAQVREYLNSGARH
jgi:hypothetical protein